MSIFDFVVVGAGSAGSVVSAYLARSGHNLSIALLEAGEDNLALTNLGDARTGAADFAPDFFYQFRAKCNSGLQRQALETSVILDWGGLKPSSWHAVDGQCVGCSAHGCMLQGRALGGGAAVNGQIYTRPAADDFPMWSPKEVVAACNVLESDIPRLLVSASWEELGSVLRAFAGSFEDTVPNLRWRLDPHEEGAPTARISGHFRSQRPPRRTNKTGVYRIPSWKKRARARSTPYDNLIRNHAGRASPAAALQVFVNATVVRVLLAEGQAIGVETAHGQVFKARREVVLSAGAFGTPRLLHRSGLGPVDVNGHGTFHLQDQYVLWLTVRLSALGCGENVVGREARELHIFFNATRPTSARRHASAEFEIWVIEDCCKGIYCLKLGVILLRPSSAGHLRVRRGQQSAGGRQRDLEYSLTLRPEAMRRFKAAVERIRKAMRHFAKRLEDAHGFKAGLRLDPLLLLGTSSHEFEVGLRSRSYNFWHPTATCPVGHIVDRRLRVVGVKNLRVADASVLSDVSGHTDAAAQVVGYLAAKEIATSIGPHKRLLVDVFS